ncbi:MAG TPA: ATP synthase F1 subunit delta [Candidatus Baltobacteraceae bacterium]|nr:ATP synthase F1 subunit delta [Candidatus Baltobacteraceae bacterium]
MPRIAENYGQALYQATAGLDEKEVKKALERFVEILASRNELELAPKVIEAFQAEARREEGVHEVRFTAAEELTEDRKKQLTASFAKTLDAPVEMTWKTDPSLIAGAVVQYDDILLDASVKGSLDRLKKSLT